MEKYVIEAKNINKSFNEIKVVQGVDFTVKRGEIKCLAGENGCGKSTLVKILSGIYVPDKNLDSYIKVNGNKYDNLSPKTAINEGIQVIYQDLSLFEFMTVAENIAISYLINENKRFISKELVHEIANRQIEKLGFSIELDKKVNELSIANKQLVAICRALSLEAKVIFMDEPTTALTKKEIDALLKMILELKNRGISVVFISHKLDEVFHISDTITVIRDGEKVGDFKNKDLDSETLSYYMTGKKVFYKKYENEIEDKVKLLSVENLSKEGMYRNINFDLNSGDILGMVGLLGSGRTEIALTLAGLNTNYSGKIYKLGKEINIKSTNDAIKNKIYILPENRLTQGLFLEESQRKNITATILEKVSNKVGIIKGKKEKIKADNLIKEMGVNVKNAELSVNKLSGGNQQKVVLGKCIADEPEVLILDSPTVGIDIGSKAEIYERIHMSAKKGMGIVFISDEIDELLANCNKIILLGEGEIIETIEVKKDNRLHEQKKYIEKIISIGKEVNIEDKKA